MVPIQYHDLFPKSKPLIACIHLLALPGAPLYKGDLQGIYDRALAETAIFVEQGVDALIVENFRDVPFYPNRVPTETIATMAAVCREIRNNCDIPLGINVLRNDADAALSVATAIGADFIRINVHNAAVLTDQGLVQGRAYDTLRKRN
ncbi:MAG TPA: phosphorybosylanthranilate isomerase, partial [Bacteroidetes bacterium]|nr:phosphorybosylanthranilate isomerase [Bacteroidota bacterium]